MDHAQDEQTAGALALEETLKFLFEMDVEMNRI
jgi:hypothetical protein